MRSWVVVITRDRHATEALYAFDALILPGSAPTDPAPVDLVPVPDRVPDPGDQVVLAVEGKPALVFGLGRVRSSADELEIRYTHRRFDAPLPLAGEPPLGVSAIADDEYERLASQVGSDRRTDADKTYWFVSVSMPIEASSPAEAVREFWTYVEKLGPRELPAFVWPQRDELSMQLYVHGEPSTEDPED